MQSNGIPAKFPIPFASSAGAAYIRPVPQASQEAVTPGAASLTDGFPPLNFQALAAGGVPPFGEDFNGILNQITAWSQWQAAGNAVQYDAAFSSEIGGYPAGAVLASNPAGSLWLCTEDNNTSDPDSGGAGWVNIGAAQNFTLTAAEIDAALGYTPANADLFPVTNPNLAEMAADTVKANLTADPASPQDVTLAALAAALAADLGSGVITFNTRAGAVMLESADVIAALGYTPFNQAGGNISGAVTIINQTAVRVVSGTTANSGLISWGAGAPSSTLDIGEIWLQTS